MITSLDKKECVRLINFYFNHMDLPIPPISKVRRNTIPQSLTKQVQLLMSPLLK